MHAVKYTHFPRTQWKMVVVVEKYERVNNNNKKQCK